MILNISKKTTLPHQYEFLSDCETKILGMIAGFGSGKTYAFVKKAFICHLFYKCTKTDSLIGKSNGWILYPTLQLAESLFIDNFFYLLEHFNIKYKINKKNLLITTDYGNLQLGTMEKPQRLVGQALTYCGIDEFDTTKHSKAIEVFEKVVGRMRGADRTQIFITSTPEGFSGAYDVFVKYNKNKDRKVIHAKTTDNPYLPKPYIESLKKNYDMKTLKAYLLGQFVNMKKGQVYYNFDRGTNLIKNKEIEISPLAELCIAFDFNIQPFCFVIIQKINGISYVIKEFRSRSQSNTQDACNWIITNISNDYNVVIYGDASGNARNTMSDYTNYQIIHNNLNNYFKSLTFRIPTANPPVISRVNQMNNIFEKKKLYINATCEYLIQDLEQVSWNDKNKDIDKSNIELTHISDALGYYVFIEHPLIEFKKEKSTLL